MVEWSEAQVLEWTALIDLPPGCALSPVWADRAPTRFRMIDRELQAPQVGFEKMCHDLEKAFEDSGLACACCRDGTDEGACPRCVHAVGFHQCPLQEAS